MKISVIVPVYNVEKYLDQCLLSLKDQDYEDFEVIVVNDGSTDGCANILKNYEADPQFQIVHQENIGLGGARNSGLAKASGDYIVYLDSDDWVSPDFLSNLMRPGLGGKLADVIVCRFAKVSDDGKEILELQPLKRNPDGQRLKPYQQVLGAFTSSVAWGKAIRRELAQSLLFDPSLPHEDLFFTYKLFHRAESITWKKKATLFWRQRPGSLGRSADSRHARAAVKLLEDTDAFLAAHGSEGDSAIASRRAVIVLDSIFKRLQPIKLGSESAEILESVSDLFFQKYDEAVNSPLCQAGLPTNLRNWYRARQEATERQGRQADAELVPGEAPVKSASLSSKPQFSIVTPSFNQGEYIEKCLRSVHEQRGVSLEHIVFDAGSTDGSLDVLEQYQSRFGMELHVGEDRSQSNAINLGFERARGEIIAWLNTDDYYVSPDVLEQVWAIFDQNPHLDIVYGKGNFISSTGEFIREAYIAEGEPVEFLFHSVGILQPALFMRRSVFEDVGPINESLRYAMDYEYWIRCAMSGKQFRHVDLFVCEAVLHQNSKTFGERPASLAETLDVAQSLYGICAREWCEKLAAVQLENADGIATTASTQSSALQAAARAEFARRLPVANLLDTPKRVMGSPVFQKTAELLRLSSFADGSGVALLVDDDAFGYALQVIRQNLDLQFYVLTTSLSRSQQRVLAMAGNCSVRQLACDASVMPHVAIDTLFQILKRFDSASSVLLVDLTDPYLRLWISSAGGALRGASKTGITTFFGASYLLSGVLPKLVADELKAIKIAGGHPVWSPSIMTLCNDSLFRKFHAVLANSMGKGERRARKRVHAHEARNSFWVDLIRFCHAERCAAAKLEDLNGLKEVSSEELIAEHV